MWLFADHGFTSTVAYDPSKDMRDTQHKKVAKASSDPKGMWLLIRARVKEDLMEVEKALQTIKGDDKFSIYIDTDKGADYSFRALITRADMAAYVADRVMKIDYGSHFKEVAEKRSTQGKERHSAMMSVWSAMARLQPHTPYGGTYTSGGVTYYGSAPVSPAAAFKPSTKWIRPEDVKEALTKAALTEWADDFIEGMDDDAFEFWLAACKHVPFDKQSAPITDEDVDDLVDLLYEETVEVSTI